MGTLALALLALALVGWCVKRFCAPPRSTHRRHDDLEWAHHGSDQH